jgi:hypothetical protein
MTQATDIDIRELKDLILGLDKKIEAIDKKMDTGFAAIDKKIDVGFANVDTRITRLDGRIDTLETRVLGKFETVNAKITNLEANTKAVGDLAEKVGELKNWKQIAIVTFTATVGGAIGYFVRSGKLY